MAKYEITSPDGARYEVTAPEGVSEQELINYIQKQNRAPVDMEANAQAALEDEFQSWNKGKQFMYGAGKSAIDTGRYLGGLVTDMGEKDEVAAGMDAAADTTGAGQAGQIAGDVAVTALPAAGAAGVAAKAIKPLGGLVGRGAVEGAVASAMLGGDAEDIGWSAALGGGLSKGIGTALPLTRSIFTGGKMSKEAKSIAEMGERMNVDIPMTAGQRVRADGGFGRKGLNMIEETLPSAPFASAVGEAREKAMGQWNIATMRDIMPKSISKEARDAITETGSEGFLQMKKVFDDEYSRLLAPLDDQLPVLSNRGLEDMESILQRAANRLTGDKSADVKQTVWNILNDFETEKLNSQTVKRAESLVRKKMRKAQIDQDVELADMYRTLRDVIRRERDAVIGKRAAKELAEVDRAYANFADIRDTMEMAGARRNDLFTPDQLDAGFAKGATGNEKAAANKEMARRAKEARKVFGAEIPRVGPGTAEKTATFQAARELGRGILGAGVTGSAGGFIAGPLGAMTAIGTPIVLSKTLANPKVARHLGGGGKKREAARRALQKTHELMMSGYPKVGLSSPYILEED